MPWFKVDDSFESHPKVKSIPRARRLKAIGLWSLAGSWAARQLTDGFVPDYMLGELAASRTEANTLVEVGLWSRVDGGYLFNDWHDWQPTKAKVEADREAAKERMRVARERKKQGSSGEVRANTSATPPNRSGEVRSTPRSLTPTRPDPTRPDPYTEADASGDAEEAPRAELAIVSDETTAQTLVGEWIDHCPNRPAGNVIGQVAKHLKAMLDEGIEPDRLRRALAAWNRKGLHPSTLPSVLHEIENRAPESRSQQATNDLFDAAMQRALERDGSLR